MPKLSPSEIEQHLGKGAGAGLVRLATISHETGAPWVIPVGYLYRNRELLITARERCSWLEDIRHDPRVCATVDDDAYPLNKVTIHGQAQIRFEPGDDDRWREFRNPPLDPEHRLVELPDGRQEWDWLQAYNVNTWNEPRALVVVPLAGSKVTSWRMPIEDEVLQETWSSRYYHGDRQGFRVTSASPDEVRVVTEEPLPPGWAPPWEATPIAAD